MATRYVNTASSGGDGTTNNTSGATAAYASLSACIDAEAADLVTATDSLLILCDGGQDTVAITAAHWSGFTTNSTYDITIRANTGNEATTAFDTGKYYHNPVSNFTSSIIFDGSTSLNVTFENIQFLRDNPYQDGTQIVQVDGSSTAAAIRFYRCHFRKTANADSDNGSRFIRVFGSGTHRFVNNIFHTTNGTTFPDAASQLIWNGIVYNNTIIAATASTVDMFDLSYTGSDYLKNNILQNDGAGDACDAGSWAGTAANLTSDATSPDGASFQSKTATFTSSSDFSLASGDTNARGNASNLASDPQFAFSTDIDQTTRSAWDIGAHEFVASGPTFTSGPTVERIADTRIVIKATATD